MTALRPTFLTAAWRDLAMVNFAVDPAVLAARVPAGTELDAFEGRTLMSVVAFRFLDTRVKGIPLPFHRCFDEVNLRFYVRRRGPEGWRRGVVFVKEVVPRRLVAFVARVAYGEPYVALPMRHEVALPTPPPWGRGHATYEWRDHGRWNRLHVEVAGEPALVSETSEEAFVTEHYWGYTRGRDGVTSEYRVEHPRWRVWRAASSSLELDSGPFYGDDLAPFLARPPTSAFVADGSEVVVRTGERIAEGPSQDGNATASRGDAPTSPSEIP